MHPKLIVIIIVGLLLITMAAVGTVTYVVVEQNRAVDEYTAQIDDLWELYGSMVTAYDEVYVDLDVAQDNLDKIERELEISGWMEVEATAYSIDDAAQGTTHINALGWDLTDERFSSIPQVAVDAAVIPLNSFIEIKGIGIYYTADTGGLVLGSRIDILMPTKQMAVDFGRQDVLVRVLERGISIK